MNFIVGKYLKLYFLTVVSDHSICILFHLFIEKTTINGYNLPNTRTEMNINKKRKTFCLHEAYFIIGKTDNEYGYKQIIKYLT